MWCSSLRGYLSWWSQYGFSRWWEDGLSKFSANSWISLHSNHPRTCPRAPPPHTHPHTGCGYCSLFIHTVFTCCHAACKLTNPEPSSQEKTKPQLLNGETLGAMKGHLKCEFYVFTWLQQHLLSLDEEATCWWGQASESFSCREVDQMI